MEYLQFYDLMGFYSYLPAKYGDLMGSNGTYWRYNIMAVHPI